MERELRQQKLRQLKTQYLTYLRTDPLPDPNHLQYFREQIEHLENGPGTLKLMENPLPGRLVLAIKPRPASPVLALYDDLTFSALLNAARTPRGVLDLELLGKSWRQQTFDGAQLEGVHEVVVAEPKVWAIIVARPETAGRFLMASAPVVAGFADCCWVVVAPECGAQREAAKVSAWRQTLSRLVASSVPAGPALSNEAAAVMVGFRERVAAALRHDPSADNRFLGQLGTLIEKISSLIHLVESDVPGLVTQAQLARAVAWAELGGGHRQTILQTSRRALVDRQFQEQCQNLLAKILALGPISWRELCRTFEDQRLERWLPMLTHLVQTEQIVKHPDGRFDIPSRWLSKLQVQIC